MCFALVYAMVLNIVYFKKNHLQTNETKYYSHPFAGDVINKINNINKINKIVTPKRK